jgi:hypothetical protein
LVSATPPGPGWWLASDGKWYPPREAEAAPGPGWWLASDGKWYPPREAEAAPGPGWWLASDGKWYPPQEQEREPAAQAQEPLTATKPSTKPARMGRAKVKGPRWRGRRKDGSKGPRPSSAEAPDTTGTAEIVDVVRGVEAAAEPTPAPSRADNAVAAGQVATSAPHDRVRPNQNEGVSPEEQIQRRDRASQADANVLRAKRSAAASRALGALQAELGSLSADQHAAGAAAPTALATASPPAAVASAPTVTRPPTTLPPSASPPSAPPVLPATSAPAPAADRIASPTPSSDRPAAKSPEPAPSSDEPPLLEVKSSGINADLEHLGDRLAIFTDHVELRDRLDRVRQSVRGEDIVDVTVQKKLTGVVLTIHSARGQGLVVKSLRTDQAEEARQLIMRKTRPVQHGPDEAATPTRPTITSTPSAPRDASSPSTPVADLPAPSPAERPTQPAPVAKPKLDQADLLSKLADLHRVGVLTDEEYAQKADLVARLVRLEQLAPTRS